MGYIEGKNVIMLIDKGTGYVPALCAVSITISSSVETKETMTVGDGTHRKPRGQRQSDSITLDGVTEFPLDSVDTYDTFNLLDNLNSFTNLSYKIYFESAEATAAGTNVIKMMIGEALVTDGSLTVGAENLMDSSFTMEGFGAYQMFNSTSACSATLASVVYSSQGTFVVFNYNGLVGSDRLEYSVDGTTRKQLIDQPSSGQIVIMTGVGLVPGAHTLEVWPVCANGDDGTSVITNYTRT